MTREKARELLPIIQAYAEGKKIQVESHNHKWFDVTELDNDFELLNYRIKPEDEEYKLIGRDCADKQNLKEYQKTRFYRPYKDCDELIDSYKRKHCIVNNEDVMPAIWVKNNNDNTKRLITTFGDIYVKVGVKTKPVSLYVLYTDYEYLDGTPCGINLEKD